MRRCTAAFVVTVAVSLAAPPVAWAIKEWYDHYRDAQYLIRENRFPEAMKSLQEAARLRPSPGLNVQTYGLNFVDYLPYYHMGLCHLRLGDFSSAVQMFNVEEKSGAVTKSRLYRDLLRLRTEAEDAERQRVARLAREDVQRLSREAAELARNRRFAEALARLAQAQAAAAPLDPATQRQIAQTIVRVRNEEKETTESLARAQRVERSLADGRKLLEESQPTEALVHFEEVLALEPKHAAALDGKREAQERILATTTRQAREKAFQEGKSFFEAGRYEEALRPLTDAATDPGNTMARDFLEKARTILEGLRIQKELGQKVARLLAEGDRLMERRRFPEAQVQFEAALQLDPGNVRAQGRRGEAEKKTGEEIINRYLPNRGPELTFFEPRQTVVQVESPTVSVVGVATDDRALASVEFRVGGKMVAQVRPPLDLGSGQSERTLPFEREFPLEKGPNEIAVTATDEQAARAMRIFVVTRQLRWFETRAFFPSALLGAVALIGIGVGVQRARRARAVRNRFNPYIAGAPVMDESMFFGRQKLMARMLNVLHHNSLMITGERRIGKTTFLYHLKRVLETDDGTEYRFFPVFTDLQGVPEDSFFQALMADIIDGLTLAPATVGSLRFRPERETYDGRDFSHDLQRVIAELKTRTSKRVKLALLIDEVDVLNEYSERVNQRLRGIFMKTFSEQLVAIMSGVGIRRTWKSEVSPWYNFFDEVELTGFTREEAEDLIRKPVEGFFRYQPEAVEAIFAWSQLKPYLIQKFCVHAVNHMLEEARTTIKLSDVESVHEMVLLEGRKETYFQAGGSHPAPAESVAD